MKLWSIAAFGLTLFSLANGAVWGQSLPAPDVLNARARALDPRLEAPVNLDADRMCLGEVLEKLSAQTGVSVSMPATDPSSGTPITCHVKNLALAEFMNSLWSLVGFSKATWRITTDGQHHPRTYSLIPTPSARALPERLTSEADKATQNLFDLFSKISKMTPKERQAYVHPLAEAMLMESDDRAKSFLQDSPLMNDGWARFGMIETELSAEQQEQLKQGVPINIPLNRLTPAHQELMRAFVVHSYADKDGVRTELPPPDQATFHMSRAAGPLKTVMRDVYIGVSSKEGGGGETGYLGVMAFGLKRNLADGWILPGDAKTLAKETEIINVLPNINAGSPWEHVPELDQLLTQVAEAQNVSSIAILPDDIHNVTLPQAGQPMKQFFEILQRNVGLIHKWRNGVLLSNYQLWFYGDDGLVPYSVVKQLRDSNARMQKEHLPLFSATANAFVPLSDVQAKRLIDVFPAVARNQRLQTIFLLYKKYPGILTEGGQSVDLNMLNLMTQWKLIPSVQSEDIESVRIIEEGVTPLSKQHLYKLQFRPLHQKEWKNLARFQIITPPPVVNPAS